MHGSLCCLCFSHRVICPLHISVLFQAIQAHQTYKDARRAEVFFIAPVAADPQLPSLKAAAMGTLRILVGNRIQFRRFPNRIHKGRRSSRERRKLLFTAVAIFMFCVLCAKMAIVPVPLITQHSILRNFTNRKADLQNNQK